MRLCAPFQLSGFDSKRWLRRLGVSSRPTVAADRKAYSTYWLKSSRLLGPLPPRANRDERVDLAARLIRGAAAAARAPDSRIFQTHFDSLSP